MMLVAGILALWWKDRSSFDQRLKKIEEMYSPVYEREPLWGAADILGPPDDPTGTAGKSWCPMGSSTADWVEVSYDYAVAAATIDIHETYSVGCVTEVIVTDDDGNKTSIWRGTDPTTTTTTTTMTRTGLFRVPVPDSIQVQRVKIHVDSSGKGSWACIDAVGLTTAAGKTTWATSSNSSSVYGPDGVSATIKRKPWYSFW
jgi:hypothetical protein